MVSKNILEYDAMTAVKSAFLRTILARGYVYQCTNLERLDAVLTQPPIPAYIGFDCTADSLHVGSLIQIMLLRRLQQAGHKPIVLIGGSTTQIGDPAGKSEARQLLSSEQIDANIVGVRSAFANFLTFGDGPSDALMINNADWLDSLNYIAFLRDYGRYFSVKRMLGFDSVKQRLEREQSLTFLEFNYMILQGYDFLELWRRTGCILQMGGADQWGNIINGIELAHRSNGIELYGLTSPLLTTASGTKMGKTTQGAVWLSASRLSPYGYWQFWRNTDDADICRFLRLFTELPLDKINQLESLTGAASNEAKEVLAFEATSLAHGVSAAYAASETAHRIFEEKVLYDDTMPTLEVPAAALTEEGGIGLLDALRQAGLVRSNSEARRLVDAKGVRINDIIVTDETRRLTLADFENDAIKLSTGRKHHILVRRTRS